MTTKKIIFLTILFFICTIKVSAQNLLKYDSKLITVSQYPNNEKGIGVNIGSLSQNSSIISYDLNSNVNKSLPSYTEIDKVIQAIILKMNNLGYSLKSSNRIIISPLSIGQEILYSIDLIFEKSTSYREEELYKLLGELNTKIDATSKSYIEKAKTEINQDVLNYLKNIPNDVLGKAYKEELQSYINTAMDKKLSDLKEQIVSELNKKP